MTKSSAKALIADNNHLDIIPLKADKKKKSKKSKSKSSDKAPERRIFHHISESEGSSKLPKKKYEKELARLQLELVKMQYWVKHTGTRIVVLFEGKCPRVYPGLIARIVVDGTSAS
ncbi:MAG: polyphosphate kinase 2, partial [Cyanobacteria bacterium]|nr:polyphosphate kinase 2 [Cyanobacteriota bacterium]